MPLCDEDALAFSHVLQQLGIAEAQVKLVLGILQPVLDSFNQTVTKKKQGDHPHNSLVPLVQAFKKKNRLQKVIDMNKPTPLTNDNLALKEQPGRFLFTTGRGPITRAHVQTGPVTGVAKKPICKKDIPKCKRPNNKTKHIC